MHKADLWHLCKLYINGGIYADIDLVPYINLELLDKNITFYSVLSNDSKSIFQAFMINFCKPNNPLILCCLMSLIINNPFTHRNGPTYDMYNCIRYNLDDINILPEKKYTINQVKIKIIIGASEHNIKLLDLNYFPNNINYEIKLVQNQYNDTFAFDIKDNYLMVKRLDTNTGWNYNHVCNIYIKSDESIFLFKENIGPNNNWVTSYVTYNNNKILDSRDLNYFYNNGY